MDYVVVVQALAYKTGPDSFATESAFAAHLKENGADDASKRKAFADVLWALLNSSEFAVTR